MSTTGSYVIWTADKQGNTIGFSSSKNNSTPNPSDPNAVDIYFGLPSDTPQPPPKEQVDLVESIDKVLGTARRLYIDKAPPRKEKFRHYYTRLFRLAQLGLEGENASPEIAKSALTAVTADLISDEAADVKNGHLTKLGRLACYFSLPFLVFYILFTSIGTGKFESWLTDMGIHRLTAANFMLLWIGCFLGVWLSYGVRTTSFTLADLSNTDSDHLLPHLKLIFSGTLTMIIGILFALGIVEIKIGSYSVTAIASNPTLAFLIGIFCGLSEVSLPASISKKASALISEIK